MQVAVYGLGKLGLPLAVLLANNGHDVIGVDPDAGLVAAVRRRESPLVEPGVQELLESADRFDATTDPGAARGCDASLVVVPTPSGPNGAFDDRMVVEAVGQIGAAIAGTGRDHTVVVTSTVMPGACDDRLAMVLSTAIGGPLDDHVDLVYSPEFMALGSVIRDLCHPDMILVGASARRHGLVAETLARSYAKNDAPCMQTTPVNAELAKLALNNYVTMKIAFANALGLICDAYGGDAVAVADIIGRDSRIGSKYIRPGGPFAGPCFPRDVQAFLAAASAAPHRDAGALAHATEVINRAVVDDVLSKIGVTGGPVAILGLAYKPGTPVVDESLGMKLCGALLARGIAVVTHDPLARPSALASYQVETPREAIGCSEVVVFTIPCPEYRSRELPSFCFAAQRIVDPWGVRR